MFAAFMKIGLGYVNSELTIFYICFILFFAFRVGSKSKHSFLYSMYRGDVKFSFIERKIKSVNISLF